MSYIYSTLATDQNYSRKDEHGNIVSSILVAGKANVPNKHMATSRGVATKVTEEQLVELRKNRVFQLHEKNKFLVVDSKKHNADKVADDMNNQDKSAPLTKPQLEAEGKQAPATKGKK